MHFYLSRLVYLDAVGSVDFTNINHTGLQVLITALNTFWSAIENKNDQFMQDALKFPLKNKFSRNDLQGERRKQNLSELRMNINTLKQGNRYGFIFSAFLCVQAMFLRWNEWSMHVIVVFVTALSLISFLFLHLTVFYLFTTDTWVRW